MKNFICNRYEERLAILNTKSIKICGWITNLEAIKVPFLPYLLNICRKFEFFISQGSNMPKVRWVVLYSFCSKVHPLSSSAKLLKKIWQSYIEFKGGNLFRHSLVGEKPHTTDLHQNLRGDCHRRHNHGCKVWTEIFRDYYITGVEVSVFLLA